MALTKYHNIDGSNGVDVELLAPGEGVSGLKSIFITNVHASNSGTIDLFLQYIPVGATAITVYVLKTVTLPVGATLVIDDKGLLAFNNSRYGLYVTVGSSDTIDVLLNT